MVTPTGGASNQSAGGKTGWNPELCNPAYCLAAPTTCYSVCCCMPFVATQVFNIVWGLNSRYFVRIMYCVFGILIIAALIAGSANVETTNRTAALIQCATGFLVFLLVCFVRCRVRDDYRLIGNPLTDCCVSFWCTPCALCQLMHQKGNGGVSLNETYETSCCPVLQGYELPKTYPRPPG